MSHTKSAELEKQLYVYPEPKGRVIILPDHRSGYPPQLWFKWKDDWVREEFCGKFPDGTPRPPWEDDKFLHLWDEKGPNVAQDKSNYDLTEQEEVLIQYGRA